MENKTIALDFDVSKTDPKIGLDTNKVDKSRGKFGSNVITSNPPKMWELILKELKQPIIILLIIAMLATFAIAIETVATPGHNGEGTLEIIPMFVEPCFILGIITFSISFTIIQENKIAKAVIMIKRLTSSDSVVIRNSKKEIINSCDLVVGDIIEVSPNQIVGADCKLISNNDLSINESILVGRELINSKDINFHSVDTTPIENRKDYIFKGTKVISGNGLAIVTSVGNQTQLGILKQAIEANEAHNLSPLQKQIDKLSKILGAIAGSVCLIFFFLDVIASCHYKNITFGDNHAIESLSISISLAIAAIPEGLLAIVTVLLTACVKKMSSRYVLVKKIPYVELLGFASSISLEDKGILDKEHLPIGRVHDFIKSDSKEENSQNKVVYKLLASFILSNNLNHLTNEQIKDFLHNNQFNFEEAIRNLKLINSWTDSNASMVLVYNEQDKKYYAVKTNNIKIDDCKSIHIDLIHKTRLEYAINDMLSDGLSAQLLSYEIFDSLPNHLNLSNTSKFKIAGLVGICDVNQCVKELIKAHITPVIVTENSLERLKEDLVDITSFEFNNDQIISSEEIKKLDDLELKNSINNYKIFVNLDSQDKLRIIAALKASSNVCVVGGYHTDEESMKEANVACSFTRISTITASDNCQVVVTNNSLSSVLAGIRLSRTVLSNIKSTLTMLLTANVACLLTTFIGILVYMVQPLCSLQLLSINILAETIIGFPMANNRRSENVMAFKPLNPKAFIIDKSMAIKIFVMGILAAGLSLLMFYVGAGAFYNYDYSAMTDLHTGLNGLADTDKSNTALNAGSSLSFLTLALILLVNGICYRTNISIFKDSIESSKKMLIVVACCILIVLLFAYIPHLNIVFQSDPYSFTTSNGCSHNLQWLNIMPYLAVCLNIGVHEVWKLIDNKMITKKQAINIDTK